LPDEAVVASSAQPRQLSTKKPGLSKENPGFSYLRKKHWAGTEPAANYFLTSSVVVVVVVAAGASVAGAIVPSAAGAAITVVSVTVVVVEVSVVAAGVSVVVVSVDFDSHDDRPAVRTRPRAATLNRLFILGVILKMG
jgi:hypothetical protein